MADVVGTDNQDDSQLRILRRTNTNVSGRRRQSFDLTRTSADGGG
jgi:hypothetical protein